MSFLFCLLVLPAVALAAIEVSLDGKFEGEDSNLNVYYSGKDLGIISENEKATFNIQDNSLKNLIEGYLGRRPNNAYLHSITPWGDLYRTYGWRQVQRTLMPMSGRILSISSQNTVVSRYGFINNTSMPVTVNVGFSQTVQNTVHNAWSINGQLDIGMDISYEFNMELNNGSQVSFSYSNPWGQDVLKMTAVTIGPSSPMYIVLQPGESASTELQATRSAVQIEMDYEASLFGHAAVNYANKHNDHHFWGLQIADVMSSSGLSNIKVSSEVVVIRFYHDPRVIVTDSQNGNVLMDVAV